MTTRLRNRSRIVRKQQPSFEQLQAACLREENDRSQPQNVTVDCGWGTLIMGHTFSSASLIAKPLLEEPAGQRNIAFYVDQPHVLLAKAPQSLFLDPSDTYRLWMTNYRPRQRVISSISVRRATSSLDAEALNTILLKRGMVPIPVKHILQHRRSKKLLYLVAVDRKSGEVVGTVMGLNHEKLFDDPDKGSSLWSLAVAPECKHGAVGEALARYLVEYFQVRGCQFLDLSVLHDNSSAKALYKKLGFERLNTFAVKKKNAINEKLFVGPQACLTLNPYAQIIIDEALARGIEVVVDDAAANLFTLRHGGRVIRCNESLTDLTSAYACKLCQNKWLTHKTLMRAGLKVPEVLLVEDDSTAQVESFLDKVGSVVVKPLDAEQGQGISVDLATLDEVKTAIQYAKGVSSQVLLESFHYGQDLRVLVIDDQVVAAAIRKPAEIVGDGVSTIKQLIDKQSRRRQAATGGESTIPIDQETSRCIKHAGWTMDDVLPQGEVLQVRKTANLHTGGTLHDVTEGLHPVIAQAALEATKALGVPVAGIDFIVPDPEQPMYVIIEANERPGLANHEPHPTAQRFVDMLFPMTKQH
ncbi:N-acetylglutaminylglutamine synthetase [Zooshikella ganghwensis]|uniref:N-acetylglutaminylglutamine synthetase n=1 Tax=Zooshikella ganghwensis TaxID=202772 RepID=UPI000415724C|nr:N-acetylglutaminylglutamine synthetase [Zooshikella ganghwensis]